MLHRPRRPPSINISPLSFLYLTMHCLDLFGRILLYQEVVLLAIVLRVRCSSDPAGGMRGRLNHHTWGCHVFAHKSEQSEVDPQVQSAATIEAANRDDRPSDRGEQGPSCE